MINLDERFRHLRVLIEPVLPASAIVLVTSVAAGDGKSYVACGLARAFAESNYSTILVDLNERNPGVASQLGISDVPVVSAPEACVTTAVETGTPQLFAMSLADEKLGRSLSLKSISSFTTALREGFDVTVIDAGCAPVSNLTLQFARAADGVVLAARKGRRMERSDREVSEMLQRVGSRIIGVVMTEGVSSHSGISVPREALMPAASTVALPT